MAEEKIKEIVSSAPLVVNGYAFGRLGDGVRAVNLNSGEAVVFLADGTVSETSMDDIEIGIVRESLSRNQKFLGEEYA